MHFKRFDQGHIQLKILFKNKEQRQTDFFKPNGTCQLQKKMHPKTLLQYKELKGMIMHTCTHDAESAGPFLFYILNTFKKCQQFINRQENSPIVLRETYRHLTICLVEIV